MATGLHLEQIIALTAPGLPSESTGTWPPRPSIHQSGNHPLRNATEQRTWACSSCLQETDGAIVRGWVTGHVFVCPLHRSLLLGRCPRCVGFLFAFQPPCPQDPSRRCTDHAAETTPIQVRDAHILAAQATYVAEPAQSAPLVHTACALQDFLETILDSDAAETTIARLHDRAETLGLPRALPSGGPAYMSIIAPELLTLAQSIQTPRVASPWQLATEMAGALGADPDRLWSGQPGYLEDIAADILQYWWGPDGRRVWRARRPPPLLVGK
jgi:hypothetical protein